MTRTLYAGLCVAAALVMSGCEWLGIGPPAAESAPAAASEAPAAPDLRPHAGLTYEEFAAAAPQYSPEGLGLSADDAARLRDAMERATPSWTAAGGGAEALIFTGCAARGCDAGRAVVGVDLATGGAFVGVRDVDGGAELRVNDRIEALLRLSAPGGRWEDVRPIESAGSATP